MRQNFENQPTVQGDRLPFVVVIGAALVAHFCLFLPLPLMIQASAMLVLAGLLPGWLLATLLVGDSEAPPARSEHGLYAVGLGYSCMVVLTLLLSYLPGGLTTWQTLLSFDLLLLVLLTLVWRQEWRLSLASIRINPPNPRSILLLGLTLLLLIGGFLRFVNLGYAEFHGDEARAVLRAAAILQGHEDVLFLHKKGPTEILLPALILAGTGHIDEATARLPFAIANLVTLLVVWQLGWRLLNPLAGWLAALLLAFDGYLIAFARFVQYQSVVLLMSVLAVLVLYHLVRTPQALARYLTLAAILLATGLLSHYDTVLTGVAILFLLGALLWQQRATPGKILRAAVPALGIGGGLLALFYVPFVLHPRFQATYTYLVEQRLVGGRSFPYNNLADVFRRSVLYNPRAAVGLMAVGVLLAVLTLYQRRLNRLVALGIGALTVLGIVIVYWQPAWWQWGKLDLTFVPFALALLVTWLARRVTLEERLLWLWFGLPFLVAIFFTAFARTHIYIFFAPWALLVGGLMAQGWQGLRTRWGQGYALLPAVIVLLVVSAVWGRYAYRYFVYNQVEVLRTSTTAQLSAESDANSLQSEDGGAVDSLYGFPFTNGWKVVGALYNQGVLQGDYETNQRYDWIPAWYTRGQHRCGSTASWYFAVDNLEPWMPGIKQVEDGLKAQGYRPWGVVAVNGQPRLTIYRNMGTGERASTPLKTFPLNAYIPTFDHLASADLPLTYPVIEDTIRHPLHVNFGNQLWLEGYDLRYQAPLKPGDTFRLTFYWRAQRLVDKRYKVFNQAFYGNGTMIAQKDSFSVCDREPTTSWSPGKLVTDVFDIPVAADAPAGTYPLYSGLYTEENGERLPILDANGQVLDNQVHVVDLTIAAVQ